MMSGIDMNRTKHVFFTVVCMCLYVFPLYALPVDLTEEDAYVRRGFETAWTTALPDTMLDMQWKVVPACKGSRPIRIMKLGFEGVPAHRMFSLGETPQEFTILMKFDLTPDDASGPALGLYLAQIGQNWEIYLNGVCIKSEMFISPRGELDKVRAVRDQVVELRPSLIKPGQNILAFRIAGDPTVDRTGFYMGKPYVIDVLSKFKVNIAESVTLMLVAIYFFFGLYHFLLYVRRPVERFNLYFGLLTILMSVYYVSRTSAITRLIIDTAVTKHIELFSMGLIVPAAMLFIEHIVRGRVSRAADIMCLLCVMLTALMNIFETEFLLVWQRTIFVPLIYILVYDVFVPLAAETKKIFSVRDGNTVKRFLCSAGLGLLITIPGNLLVGTLILAVTVTLDIIHLMSGNPTVYSQFGFFVLIMGTAVILANRFLNVHREIEELNVTLEERVADRTKQLSQANQELGAAMNEMEAMNENLVTVNRELEDAQRIAAMDMKMAVNVQMSFFPKKTPQVLGWDAAYTFKPMSGVAGDLYDFYTHNDELLGVGLFDVSGHGIASGLVTMLAKSVIFRRFNEMRNQRLSRVVEAINSDLITELVDIDNYITGILLRFKGDSVEYINAGHPDLLCKRAATGTVLTVEPKDHQFKGHFLGVEAMAGKFNELNFKMSKDDVLVLYSDCLNESTNSDGEEYGTQRIIESLRSAPANGGAQAVLDHIMEMFYDFIGAKPLDDDLSVIITKRTDGR